MAKPRLGLMHYSIFHPTAGAILPRSVPIILSLGQRSYRSGRVVVLPTRVVAHFQALKESFDQQH